MAHVIQCDHSTALQNVKSFVHVEMPVDGNACPGRYLLRPQREIVGARSGADLDEDVAMITKMNEVFAPGGAQYKSLVNDWLSLAGALQKGAANSKSPESHQEGSTLVSQYAHSGLLALQKHSMWSQAFISGNCRLESC